MMKQRKEEMKELKIILYCAIWSHPTTALSFGSRLHIKQHNQEILTFNGYFVFEFVKNGGSI